MQAAGGHGPFKRVEPWKTWWVWLWGAVGVGLLVSVWFRTPWMVWSIVMVATFGVLEALGLLYEDVGYPPLTQVIREYVPRWVAFALIYAATAMAAATWFNVPDRVGLMLLGGLVGWLTAHFDTAFDRAAVLQENTKYAWWADRLGRPGRPSGSGGAAQQEPAMRPGLACVTMPRPNGVRISRGG